MSDAAQNIIAETPAEAPVVEVKKPIRFNYDEPHIELRRLNYKMENLELSLKERGVHKDDAVVDLFLQASDCLREIRTILAVRHDQQIPLDQLMGKDETAALVAKDTAEREAKQMAEAAKRSNDNKRGNHRDKPVQHPGKTEKERVSGKAARYLQNKEEKRAANAAHQKGATGGGGGKGGKGGKH